jgi:hypothetical protein
VIATRLIDREQLHELEPDLGRPIDELPQYRHIAYSEIIVPAQPKQRRKNPRDFVF